MNGSGVRRGIGDPVTTGRGVIAGVGVKIARGAARGTAGLKGVGVANGARGV